MSEASSLLVDYYYYYYYRTVKRLALVLPALVRTLISHPGKREDCQLVLWILECDKTLNTTTWLGYDKTGQNQMSRLRCKVFYA